MKQFLHGMDSVRDFVRNIVVSIPDNAGEDNGNGSMEIPRSLENPSRKRHREDTPEPGNNAGGAFPLGKPMTEHQQGYHLIAAMLPDAGDELLDDLDNFSMASYDAWTDDQGGNA